MGSGACSLLPPSWNMEVMVGTRQPFWIMRQESWVRMRESKRWKEPGPLDGGVGTKALKGQPRSVLDVKREIPPLLSFLAPAAQLDLTVAVQCASVNGAFLVSFRSLLFKNFF